MFVKGYTSEGFKGQCYHIHMEPEGAESICERIYFRDYLISNPKVAKEYAALKKVLAKRYEFDRDAYTEAKSYFIKKATAEAIREKSKNAIRKETSEILYQSSTSPLRRTCPTP